MEEAAISSGYGLHLRTSENEYLAFPGDFASVYLEIVLNNFGKFKSLSNGGGTNTFILEDGTLRIVGGTGSQGPGSGPLYDISPTYLLQNYGIDITNGKKLSIYAFVRFSTTEGINAADRARLDLFINGQRIYADIPELKRLDVDTYSLMIHSGAGIGYGRIPNTYSHFNGYNHARGSEADFILLKAYWFRNVLTFEQYLFIYNSGKGTDLPKIIDRKRNFLAGAFDGFTKIVENGLTAGDKNFFQMGGGIPYAEYKSGTLFRKVFYVGNTFEAPTDIPKPKQFKEYWYDGAQMETLDGNGNYYTGPIKRADSESTDVPASLTKIHRGHGNRTLDIRYNKIGGETENEVAVSVVTKSPYVVWNLNAQSPLGSHDLTVYTLNNIDHFAYRNSRVAALRILPDPSLAYLRIGALEIDENRWTFNQDLSTIIDYSKSHIGYFNANYSHTLRGMFGELKEGWTDIYINETNIAGELPNFPSTLQTFNFANSPGKVKMPVAPVTGIKYMAISGGQYYGTLKLQSQELIEITIRNSNAAELILHVDLAGARCKSQVYLENVPNLRTLVLPQEASTAYYFVVNNCENLQPVNWMESQNTISTQGTFTFTNNGPQDSVIPVGTRIRAPFINISNNKMTTPTVNAILDLWIDNQANFVDAGTTKRLYLGGNAAPNNDGRPTRMDEITPLVENGWYMHLSGNDIVGQRYFRIQSVEDGTYNDSPPRILVNLNEAYETGVNAGGTFEDDVVISGTDNGMYDGTWLIKGMSWDKQRAKAGGFDNLHQNIVLEKAGASFIGSTTGVLKNNRT